MIDRDALFNAIIRGNKEPDAVWYQCGWDAHEAGKEFHDLPKNANIVSALSWRMGWNNRALSLED